MLSHSVLISPPEARDAIAHVNKKEDSLFACWHTFGVEILALCQKGKTEGKIVAYAPQDTPLRHKTHGSSLTLKKVFFTLTWPHFFDI